MGSDNSNGYISTDSSPLLSTSGIIWEAKYARSNEYFMYAGEDYKVHIFDSTNTEVYTLTDPDKKVYCGDFANDGCSLAIGSENFKVYIYTNVLGSCDPSPGGGSTPSTPTEGNCSIYTAGMKGCAICESQSACHECSVGYYLNTSSLCSTCV